MHAHLSGCSADARQLSPSRDGRYCRNTQNSAAPASTSPSMLQGYRRSRAMLRPCTEAGYRSIRMYSAVA